MNANKIRQISLAVILGLATSAQADSAIVQYLRTLSNNDWDECITIIDLDEISAAGAGSGATVTTSPSEHRRAYPVVEDFERYEPIKIFCGHNKETVRECCVTDRTVGVIIYGDSRRNEKSSIYVHGKGFWQCPGYEFSCAEAVAHAASDAPFSDVENFFYQHHVSPAMHYLLRDPIHGFDTTPHQKALKLFTHSIPRKFNNIIQPVRVTEDGPEARTDASITLWFGENKAMILGRMNANSIGVVLNPTGTGCIFVGTNPECLNPRWPTRLSYRRHNFSQEDVYLDHESILNALTYIVEKNLLGLRREEEPTLSTPERHIDPTPHASGATTDAGAEGGCTVS